MPKSLAQWGALGHPFFFVPLASFAFDFQKALGLTAMFHLASNVSKIILFRNGLNRKLLLQLGVAAVLFVILGSFLTRFFDSKILEIALSIFLILLSLIFLIKKDSVLQPGSKETIVGGSLSGFFAGFLGTGGAVRGLTMAAFNLPKEIFIATSAAIDLAVDFSRTIVYFFNGYISSEMMVYVPYLLLFGFGGTFIRKKILVYIPQERFRLISLILILLIGIASLVAIYVKKGS